MSFHSTAVSCTCIVPKTLLGRYLCVLQAATKVEKNGREYLPIMENPSCRHATRISTSPKESSHTVPHCPSTHTSTLPSLGTLPPVRRIAPELYCPLNENACHEVFVTPHCTYHTMYTCFTCMLHISYV